MAWVMAAISIGGILVQVGISLAFMRILIKEVDRLRERSHSHASMLTAHEIRLDVLEESFEQ